MFSSKTSSHIEQDKPLIIRYGIGRFINKGEDNDSTVLNVNSISAFSVFDGHYGNKASLICSSHFTPAIIKRYDTFKSTIEALILDLGNSDEEEKLRFFLRSDMFDDVILKEVRTKVRFVYTARFSY